MITAVARHPKSYQWIVSTVIAVLLTAVGLIGVVWLWSQRKLFAHQQVVAVTLVLHGPPDSRAPARAELRDPMAVSRLTRMLDRGSTTEPHPCASIGYLRLERADGSELSVSLLHEHNTEFFEYSHDAVYRRIARQEFFEAISPFCVPLESFAQPSGP